ncbi:MAG: hypothetical protein MUE64_05580 [Ignavibacteriaceae bacterium]|jgi:hypothetical protein|nr:hypothetical protein [Ignavibacterium sp.]MCU0406436.1 hypothetical protein [Ignavibacteriaceae bacterium]
MNKIFTILVSLIFANILLADPNGPSGELLIKFLTGTPIGTFKVSVSSTDYSWHWENNTVVIDNDLFSHTDSNKTYYTFGSPKTSNGHGDYRISWGLFTFTITTNTGLSSTFQLDLRDENWAEYYYPSHDTYILINDASNEFYISISEVGGEKIDNGAFIELWDLWELTPIQSNFKIPVTLKNRIEGGPSTDFGALWANNHQVPSGSVEGFKYDITKNVEHHTIETNYNNERKYSFKWIPIQVDFTNNVYGSSTNFTIQVTPLPKDVTRNFKTVWPLKIKNVSIESVSTESFGDIYFKDPTTDNQFHLYLASGENGFEKNEAFENLEVDPGNGNLQRYSVKAVSTIPYNGRNYYWYRGNLIQTHQQIF